MFVAIGVIVRDSALSEGSRLALNLPARHGSAAEENDALHLLVENEVVESCNERRVRRSSSRMQRTTYKIDSHLLQRDPN